MWYITVGQDKLMTGWVLFFLISCVLIVVAGKLVIEALIRVSRFLGWKEFVVAFFAVSLGAVLPEFFIGITSALKGIPQLSLGNIFGENIILFSLAPGLSVLILKSLEMESRTVRAGSTFAVLAAILPLLLIWDGELSRIDGVILILCFPLYIFWLFSKKERFSKIYEQEERQPIIKSFFSFLKDIAIIFGGLFLIVLFAQGIISSAEVFSEALKISLPLVGILIVSLGTALPETYLSINLARAGQSWMILGGLMGSVAISSTLVLGSVAIIRPIVVPDLFSFAIARLFLIISALFFLFFLKTDNKITLKEALFLFGIYIAFLMVEILIK